MSNIVFPPTNSVDPRLVPLASWLYERAIATRMCERCDPEVMPPLYIMLAQAMLADPETVTRLINRNGTTRL